MDKNKNVIHDTMQKIMLCLLLITYGSTTIAQNVMKVLKSETDGFNWNMTFEAGQNVSFGAETLDGKTIIPLSKKYNVVAYSSPYLIGMYHSGKSIDSFKKEYYTKDGKELLDNSKYDDTRLLGGKNGEPFWFLTQKEGKKGVCDSNGKEIIPPLFKSCVYMNGEFTIEDDNGFQTWNEYNDSHNSNNSEYTPDITELYEFAYNTPDSLAQTKINRYMRIILADPYDNSGYMVRTYYSIGELYEKLRDLNNAKTYYQLAERISSAYDKAEEDLKNIKAQRTVDRRSIIADILGQIGEALGNQSVPQWNQPFVENGTSDVYYSKKTSLKTKKKGTTVSAALNSQGEHRAYNEAVSLLSRMKTGLDPYDDVMRRRIQGQMKFLRKNDNSIRKDPLEDWDGGK